MVGDHQEFKHLKNHKEVFSFLIPNLLYLRSIKEILIGGEIELKPVVLHKIGIITG